MFSPPVLSSMHRPVLCRGKTAVGPCTAHTEFSSLPIDHTSLSSQRQGFEAAKQFIYKWVRPNKKISVSGYGSENFR